MNISAPPINETRFSADFVAYEYEKRRAEVNGPATDEMKILANLWVRLRALLDRGVETIALPTTVDDGIDIDALTQKIEQAEGKKQEVDMEALLRALRGEAERDQILPFGEVVVSPLSSSVEPIQPATQKETTPDIKTLIHGLQEEFERNWGLPIDSSVSETRASAQVSTGSVLTQEEIAHLLHGPDDVLVEMSFAEHMAHIDPTDPDYVPEDVLAIIREGRSVAAEKADEEFVFSNILDVKAENLDEAVHYLQALREEKAAMLPKEDMVANHLRQEMAKGESSDIRVALRYFEDVLEERISNPMDSKAEAEDTYRRLVELHDMDVRTIDFAVDQKGYVDTEKLMASIERQSENTVAAYEQLAKIYNDPNLDEAALNDPRLHLEPDELNAYICAYNVLVEKGWAAPVEQPTVVEPVAETAEETAAEEPDELKGDTPEQTASSELREIMEEIRDAKPKPLSEVLLAGFKATGKKMGEIGSSLLLTVSTPETVERVKNMARNGLSRLSNRKTPTPV